MKTISLLIAIISISCITFSQPWIKYDYDASGNRISRTIILTKSSKVDSVAVSAGITNEQPSTENLSKDLKLLIYPNPARDELTVEFVSDTELPVSSLFFYNISGQLLLSKQKIMKQNIINLSAFSPGTYVLKVICGNKPVSWKVIKQ